MSASGRNFEAIARAKVIHNERCSSPPHTILMHPIEIERMGWEEGDRISGLELKAEPSIGTGTFRLLCDRDRQPDEGETTEAVAEDRDLVHA